MNYQIQALFVCHYSHLAIWRRIALFSFISVTGFPRKAFKVILDLPIHIFWKFEGAFVFLQSII